MVLIDMVQRLQASTEVFYIDTDYLFPETHDTIASARAHWPGVNVVGYGPELTTAGQIELHGPELWDRDPDLCCDIRKVEPNREALRGKRAWVSGLRRDQTGREETPAVQWDEKFGLVKVNPPHQLGREAALVLHLRARAALQPAPRPRFPEHRLHELHARGPARRGPAGGTLVWLR